MPERKKTKKEASSGVGGAVPLPSFGLAEDILGAAGPAGKKPTGNGANSSGGPTSSETMLEKYVTFVLDREEYGLPIAQVQEINRVTEITRVPNSPEHVVGVVNLRGRILPVIELKRRLNIGSSEITGQSRIVVVEAGAKVLGLLVDRVAQVLNLAPEEIEQAPEEVVRVDQNMIKGVGKIDDRMVLVLDLGEVIGNSSLKSS